jgi:hypothetical protein
MRHFVNYVAVPLFYNTAPQDVYELLTSLVIGLHLLGGASREPVPDKDLDLARKLMDYFVATALNRHFSRVATPGMHMLLHIADDCDTLKCHMDYLGAWPFENAMKVILASRRSNYRAIQQILRREAENLNCRLPSDEQGRIVSLVPLSQYVGEESGNSVSVKPVIVTNMRHKKTLVMPKAMGGYKLKANVRDAFCVVATGTRPKDFVIVQCSDFHEDKADGGVIVVGNPYKKWSDIFQKPKPSHRYQIYRFRDKLEGKIKFRAEKIITKLYALPDLKVLANNPELESVYKYRNTPYPKNEVWAAKKLIDNPAWFGTGIKHIMNNGASLY